MDTKYLLQKGNRWYVRVAIPRPLWAQYTGKRHILKSLKTGDLKTAQRRRHTAVAAIKSGLEAEVSKYRKATRLVEQGVHTPGELIQATRMMVDDEGINIGHYTDWIWNLLEERFGLSENDGRPVLPPDWQPAISAGVRAGQGYSRTPRQRCPGGLSEGQAARQGVHPQDKGTLCAEVPGLDGGVMSSWPASLVISPTGMSPMR